MGDRVRAHVHISGRVQGVFFRQESSQIARTLGLSGWIRNLADGRVEAIFEGNETAVTKIIDWCRSGPTFARVEDVSVEWETPAGDSGFSIR